MPDAVIYMIITWAETKILKDDSPSFKDFHAVRLQAYVR